MLENALLDVAPDEALALNKKKRITRWDAKKRKFVKVVYFHHKFMINVLITSHDSFMIYLSLAITRRHGRFAAERFKAYSNREWCHP